MNGTYAQIPSLVEVQNTIFVSKNGDDSTGQRNDWTQPFLTITGAKAIAQAGDTIYVFAGLYNEGTNDIIKSDVYYWFEFGSHVQCLNRVIDDFGAVKNILVDGAGVFEVTNINFSFGTVGMQNPASTMYFRGDKMLGGGNGFNINNALSFDVEVNTIVTEQYGINIRGNCSGNIKFGSIASSGSCILFRNLGTDLVERTVTVIGRRCETSVSAFGGSVVGWVNTNNTKTIVKDFSMLNTGASAGGLFYSLVGNTGKNLISNVTAKAINGYGVQIQTPSAFQFENCIIDCVTYSLWVDNGSVYAINCQFKSADNVNVNGFGVVLFSLGELDLDDCVVFHNSTIATNHIVDVRNNNLRMRNCKLVANNNMAQSIYNNLLAPVNVKIEGQCATNKPVDANITNIIAGTNIIVDANVGLNSNLF